MNILEYYGIWLSAESFTVLRNVTLCWLSYDIIQDVMLCYVRCHIIEECDALLMKILQSYGIWRCVDERITLLRNITLCW